MKDMFRFCPLCGAFLRKSRIDGQIRLVCSKCEWIRYRNPLSVTSCVVLNKKGKILVAKRNLDPGKGKWALPGGFVELNETPEKSCLRELKEEIGIKGKIIRLAGVYSHNTKEYGDLLIIGYLVNALEEKLKINNEVQEAKFVEKENIPYIPFLAHRKLIKDALAG